MQQSNSSDLQKKVAKYLPQLNDSVGQLLILLTQKEKHVIERRYSLDKKDRSTLEEIGKDFNVTRERIRQIENNALTKLKRNIEKYDVFEVNNLAYEILKDNLAMREETLFSRLLMKMDTFSISALRLILSLDKRFEHVGNTIKYYPYFRLNDITLAEINDICAAGISVLNKTKEVMSIETLYNEIAPKFAILKKSPADALHSILDLNKAVKFTDLGVGLINWRHINPKTLRDKIYFILRDNKEPMHFVEIANEIMSRSFDKKRVNLQAVHNELIRFKDFVLIGRGIYALKEWGFSHGTVADVIRDILNEKDSLSEEQIIKAVLEKRQVKKITIVLNLKNKKYFTRVGRKQYALKK